MKISNKNYELFTVNIPVLNTINIVTYRPPKTEIEELVI